MTRRAVKCLLISHPLTSITRSPHAETHPDRTPIEARQGRCRSRGRVVAGVVWMATGAPLGSRAGRCRISRPLSNTPRLPTTSHSECFHRSRPLSNTRPAPRWGSHAPPHDNLASPTAQSSGSQRPPQKARLTDRPERTPRGVDLARPVPNVLIQWIGAGGLFWSDTSSQAPSVTNRNTP